MKRKKALWYPLIERQRDKYARLIASGSVIDLPYTITPQHLVDDLYRLIELYGRDSWMLGFTLVNAPMGKKNISKMIDANHLASICQLHNQLTAQGLTVSEETKEEVNDEKRMLQADNNVL